MSQDNVGGMVVLEIPNKERSIVRLADVQAGRPDDPHNSELLFPAGMSTQNAPVWFSLRAVPHLLVAGTTGGGKSVFMHSLITSLVANYSPYRLKLSLIDAKQGVEFGAYDDLLNYRFGCPANDPESATAELYRVIDEMRERFTLMARHGVRNIDALGEETPPYIVVCVDELADLFDQCPETQDSLITLAQLGRAAGIHLVVATQRPSFDVIKGRVKANFPGRAAFTAASMVDSRVILDEGGAEKLSGSGDALFRVPGHETVRVASCFVSSEEITRLVSERKDLQ